MRQIRPGLWQGDSSDLNVLKLDEARAKLGFTLAINVGGTNFVPPDVCAVHLPMRDSPDPGDNDWGRVVEFVWMAAWEVLRGGKVLVACDVGVNRSVVFAGMVVSVLEGAPMDDELVGRVRAFIGPDRDLWDLAARMLRARDGGAR